VAEPGPALAERISALDDAVEIADGRLDDALVARARAVLNKAQERLAKGSDLVVVALGGGTGSGKSSLFNALAGAPLSRVGPVRPVTGEPISFSVRGPEIDATPVLDWLGVRRRHDGTPGALEEGLVLIDLPDHDSVEVEHREIVDRYVERVDVLVWVVDPLKYAQRAVHDGYLRLLAAHARVVVVVLNQVDALGRDARAAVLHDLRRLLNEEGLSRAKLLATSVRTGEGIDGLRSTVNDFVVERRAVAERIAGDLGNVAQAMATQVGPPKSAAFDADALSRALVVAAGVEPLAETGRRTYLDDANDASRAKIIGAVLRRVRSIRNPMRRLKRPEGARAQEVSTVAVRHAVLSLADQAAADLPHPWPQRLHAAAQTVATQLPADVGKALDRVDVHDVKPRGWWRVFAAVATVLEVTTVIGLIWLTMLAVVQYLQLPDPPTPEVGAAPLPTVLALGGLVAGMLWAFARRRAVAAGAARHHSGVLQRLEKAVAAVAVEQAVRPMREELDAHARLSAALHRAAGRTARG
jgi:GTP-binding protein EngB required for normal cell division